VVNRGEKMAKEKHHELLGAFIYLVMDVPLLDKRYFKGKTLTRDILRSKNKGQGRVDPALLVGALR
jgi:hypothetical protein